MDSDVADEGLDAVLSRLDTVVDALAALPLEACSDSDVLAVWQRLETVSRRLASVDHAVIGQVRDRHLDFAHGATSVVALARLVLRIPIREARPRVAAAEAAGPHRSLIGESLPAVFEHVAAAQADGAISAAHARIVVQTIERLPGAVAHEHGGPAEAFLVQQARVLDPDALAKIAQHLADTLDPDGRLPDYDEQQARRDLRLTRRPDGSARLQGELTAELYEHLATCFDSLGRPRPATAGADGTVLTKDIRTVGQRQHDALLELVHAAEQAESLPNAGGVTTTLILTADATDWADGVGIVRTGHGQIVPTREAWRWVSGQTRTMRVELDRTGAITSATDTRRIFTENQRLAMIARDKGCAFPGCDAPPQWTQAHHLDEHATGGPTTIDNGCLMCSYHHRHFQQMGWRSIQRHGIPHFVPPAVLDRERQPIRNTARPAAHFSPV